jgi:hypothetical protein
VAESNLMLHRGARIVSRSELEAIPAPPATETWFPVRHGQVLDAVLATLDGAGFSVARSQFALTRNDARFFGTLDLATPVSNGVTLSVGVRNSIDKSFPLGFCAGSRVFVCDNLAFRSELLVKRKHTMHGNVRFQEAIALAVQSLGQFRDVETYRVETMRSYQLDDMEAESLILRAYERRIISNRMLMPVLAGWRNPTHPEFEDRNLWSLMNAFTGALQFRMKLNPQQFALQTMQLNSLLAPSEDGPDEFDEQDWQEDE